MWSSSTAASSSSAANGTSNSSSGPSSTTVKTKASIPLASHFSFGNSSTLKAGPSGSSTSNKSSTKLSGSNVLKPTPISLTNSHLRAKAGPGAKIGPFPARVHALIASYLPLSDVPSYALVCKGLSKVVLTNEKAWERRLAVVHVDKNAWRGKRGERGELRSPTSPRQAGPTSSSRGGLSSSPANRHRSQFSPKVPQSATLAGLNISGALNHASGHEDDDFGDFSEVAIKSASAAPDSNGKNLLDVDFEDPDIPLPSNPHPQGHTRQTSGFFAITSSPNTPKLDGGQNHRRSGSFSFQPNGLGHEGLKPCDGYLAFREHVENLMPFIRILRETSHVTSTVSPSQVLAMLFPANRFSSTLAYQATTLQALLRYLSDGIEPTKDWGWLRQVIQGVCDRFEAVCLSSFENAESKGAGSSTAVSANPVRSESELRDMKSAAESSWTVWKTVQETKTKQATRTARSLFARDDEEASQWELGRVWVEKREVFYEASKWDSSENLLKISDASGTVHRLDFSAMNEYIAYLTRCILVDGNEAISIFPGDAGASVVKGYADRLALDMVAEYVNPLVSQCRLLSPSLFLTACAACFVQAWTLVDVFESLGVPNTSSAVEASFFRMFEPNMDEYLEEEAEWAKQTLSKMSAEWERQLSKSAIQAGEASFLSSSNPDQVKRNVLASFRDVLLLPVTVVPNTVSYGVNAIVTGGQSAVNGLSMLNPQRWSQPTRAATSQPATDIQEPDTMRGDDSVVAMATKETEETPDGAGTPDESQAEKKDEETDRTEEASAADTFKNLQLMLSLEVVLQLIQADRESLKRVETFKRYPGQYARKVRETIEELFILLLKDVGNRHVAPGFRKAIDEMGTYRPADHAASTSVAPLLQFFELVHVGDTIQSMIQVYFDRELSSYIDKTDFLDAAMQEKKRFEATLDDSVAAGLNAGIEVLMNQVEHIIQTKTQPRAYYPDGPPDLGPTEGCREAIACLEMHCNLLRGSTSKEVLEVFFQEVGIRLQSILQRHIKRQIISLEGGFQMIADLNAYYSFVASLKQSRITEDFSNLKMLGHVYIVEDAKDLAAIVRDVTRYGGSFRPEDIYEFIQRRADWKKIQQEVDRAMYSISLKEDCVIM